MSFAHAFAGNPLDRAALERRDASWVERRLADPGSRFLFLDRLRPLLRRSERGLEIHWIRGAVASGRLDPARARDHAVLLGIDDGGTAHFALPVSASGSAGRAEPDAALAPARYRDTRTSAALLGVGEGAIVAQARSLLAWHETHPFCARCGAATSPVEGGYARRCARETCGAMHFPRTDPVVIMVVEHGQRLLLGRPVREPPYPADVFSCLAGYVEPGESVEEAVRREVREEAGIEVGRVRYHSSQPWPFPSSLMLGCFAEAVTDAIRIDPHELESARWFSRDEARRALDRWEAGAGVRLPSPITAAHQLIAAWLRNPSGSGPDAAETEVRP